nr:hypothetical protein [Tanacetum cinerariifolium]
MHKAFPLLEEVPTASEETSHYQKKRDATAMKVALLLKSRRKCQSKSHDSYAKLVPHVTPCILGITVIVTPYVKDQLWTHTQNLMHAPVECKLYDTCGVHHVTAKDKEAFMLVEKDYPLRKGLAIVMICYKLQVENYS